MFDALFGKKTGKNAAARPAFKGPIYLASKPGTTATAGSSAGLAFRVGVTARREIEQRIGPAIGYPAPGWQTWTLSGLRHEEWILSAFYRAGILIAVEHYLAKTDQLPKYAPRIKGIFRFVPDDVGLGSRIDALPDYYASAEGLTGGVRSVVYQQVFAARWTGGVALASGNDGRIERLALYAGAPTRPST
jgi:hypothetical protein